MNDNPAFHFLKVSGKIAGNKQREFEQTVRFVFNQLPFECTEHTLSKDVYNEGRYYFFSLWLNERFLKKFMESEEYQLISGAYDTLGSMEISIYGAIE